MSEPATNIPFSFQQPVGTDRYRYRKTPLNDNCWMKLYMSGNPFAAVLSFVDAEDKCIHVPDGFVLTDITRPQPIEPMTSFNQESQLFALAIKHEYAFTYQGKTGKLILQWSLPGDFIWE
jgi:hypothetical protein